MRQSFYARRMARSASKESLDGGSGGGNGSAPSSPTTTSQSKPPVTPIQTSRKGTHRAGSKDMTDDDEDVPLSGGSSTRRTLIERMSFRKSTKHKSTENTTTTTTQPQQLTLDSTNPLFAKALALGLDLGMTDGTFRGMEIDPRLSIDGGELVTSVPRSTEEGEEEEHGDDLGGDHHHNNIHDDTNRPQSVRRPTTFAAYLANQKALQADLVELAAQEDASTTTTTSSSTTPFLTKPTHSPWAGVLLSHLKSLPITSNNKNATVDDVAQSLCLATAQHATYVDQLLANPTTRHVIKTPCADVAILYARDCLWSDLMNALVIDPSSSTTRDRFIWMDIFTEPQVPRDVPSAHPRLASASTTSLKAFAAAIKDFAACELVLAPMWVSSPNSNVAGEEDETALLTSPQAPPPKEDVASIPFALSRSWVHFQVFAAMKENIPVIVRCPTTQVEKFLSIAGDGIARSFYMSLFHATELKRSHAWHETDKTAVLGLMRESKAAGNELSNVLKRWLFMILDKAIDEHKNTKQGAFLLNSRAHVCYASGEIDSAFQCYSKCCELIRELLGPDSPSLGVVLSQQAEVLRDKYRYEAALKIYEEVLRISTIAHGPNNAECAIDLCNIAFVLQDLRRWQESKEKLDRALAIRKQVLGRNALTADTLRDIGSLLHARGRSTKAIPYFTEAISIEREVLGPNSLCLAETLHTLGQIFMSLREWDDAVAKFQEAYAIRKEQLGEDDPDTLASYGLEGLVCLSRADFANAKTILHFVMEKRKRVLGIEHPDVAASMSNFALLLHKTGDLDGARRMYEHALTIRKKAFGTQHRDVAKTMSNLAFVLIEKGREDEARQMGRDALNILEKVLGMEDPNTVMMRNWWG